MLSADCVIATKRGLKDMPTQDECYAEMARLHAKALRAILKKWQDAQRDRDAVGIVDAQIERDAVLSDATPT